MANALTSKSSVSVERRAEFVECLSFVLGKIREAALDSFRCQRQVEVAFSGMLFRKNFGASYRMPSVSQKVAFGGILFGKKGATRIRIIAFRPLSSEHAFASHVMLSEHDRQAIAELIVRARTDGDLCELEPLGWFRAQPTSDLRLSKWDTELFNYFFNEPWQIGLVVQAVKSAPTRARFFLRESDGALRPESYRELIAPTIPRNLLLRLEKKAVAEPLTRPAPVAAWPASVPMRHHPPWIPSWTATATLGIVLPLVYWWASSFEKVSLPTPLNQPLAANQDADRREQAERQAAALWKKFEEETWRPTPETEAGAAAAKLHEEALTTELQVPPRGELARPPAVPMQPSSPARADKNPDTEWQRSMPALQAQIKPTAPLSAPPRVMEREPPPATPSHLQPSWHASRVAQPVSAAPAVNSAPTSSVSGRLPGTPAMLTVLPGEPSDVVPGQGVHQVLPEVPRKARDTIQGTIRVRVKVRADPSGSVVVATLDSPGPSRYFAELALQAARRWKFSPARNDSQHVSSEWILQFEFAKGATRVSPVYIARPTAR